MLAMAVVHPGRWIGLPLVWLALSCGGGPRPAAGAWVGEQITFNVSPDGSTITKEGSTLDEGAAIIVRVTVDRNRAGVSGVTRYVYDEVPIDAGAFTYTKDGSNGTFEVSGRFWTSDSAGGGFQLSEEIRVSAFRTSRVSGSGDWTATAESHAGR